MTFRNISIKNTLVVSKHYIFIFFLLCLVFGFNSCGKGKNDVYVISSGSDAKDFVEKEAEKNSYEKKIKEVNFKLKYISNDQMALQQINDLSQINQLQFDSIVRNYDSLLFFSLEIDIDNFSEELLKYKLDENVDASYNERVDYYSFGMQKDINIVLSEKDTIPCVLYHYERNYGISPKNKFMIGFKTSKLKDAVFVYENKFLKTGTIKFEIKEQDILNHTRIKID